MMKNKSAQIDKLLSKLSREELSEFIKKECGANSELRDRFIALGVGSVFAPKAEEYTGRVKRLIDKHTDEYDFIDDDGAYEIGYGINRILGEADAPLTQGRHDVAFAVITGVTDAIGDLYDYTEDNDGDLGEAINNCFEYLRKLGGDDGLSEQLRDRLVDFVMSCFVRGYLGQWDWYWEFVGTAVTIARTPAQRKVISDILESKIDGGDSWGSEYARRQIRNFQLELMSRSSSIEEQKQFMADNVGNPDFRRKLLQMAFHSDDLDEVLRLAADGIDHDSQYRGLVDEWKRWQYQAYHHRGDEAGEMSLVRYFLLEAPSGTAGEFSIETMYRRYKELTPLSKTSEAIENLLAEARRMNSLDLTLHIFCSEKMWDRYMDFLRERPCRFNLEAAPGELVRLYREEFVKLYESCVRGTLARAGDRKAYADCADMLRKLKRYGGEAMVKAIVAEQISRRPRRPALIEELSKLESVYI